MELKTGYKQTEVGVIPSDWEVKKIGELGKFSKGSGVRKDESLSGDIPCVRYGELYTRHSDYIKQFYSFISKEISETAKKLKTGDILFAGSGETKEEIGKSVAFIDEFDAYAGGDIVILTPTNVEPLYLGYLLNAPIVQKQKASRGQGDAVVHISAAQLAIISISLPPTKAEQTAIATALSDTDQYITHLEKLIAKKRNIKEGAMQELLKPKEGWVVRKLGEIAPLQRGFDLPNKDLREGNYPVIYSNGIGNYHNIYQVKSSGVVTGRSGTIGKVTFVEQDYWPHNTALWVTDFKGNCPKFIFYLFLHIKLEKFATGSGVPTLNRNDVHDFHVSIPPFDDQTKIATILTDMDSEITIIETKLFKAKNIKQGMMQQLLTGKIRLI
jgi:type I restriction enzyme S subunit